MVVFQCRLLNSSTPALLTQGLHLRMDNHHHNHPQKSLSKYCNKQCQICLTGWRKCQIKMTFLLKQNYHLTCKRPSRKSFETITCVVESLKTWHGQRPPSQIRNVKALC
mmetsp:Transcript_55837/g.161898  ORF Transcript_55837/g.161898 Transcript_55837/m.161898 type:complete len:109 (-) Transcript_55837:104-430(-)